MTDVIVLFFVEVACKLGLEFCDLVGSFVAESDCLCRGGCLVVAGFMILSESYCGRE